MFKKTWWLIGLLMLAESGSAAEQRCLLLYSYHSGYGWNDRIDRGATSTLDGVCEIKRFYLDSKREKDIPAIQKKAEEARELIESWKPDVVIAADDNASRHVVVPFFKDHSIPFLFCGVNWDATEYGYPFSNVTGMVEVSPVVPLVNVVVQYGNRNRPVHFLAANVITQEKEFARFQREFKKWGVELQPRFVSTQEEWKQAYYAAGEDAVLVLGNPAGIRGWNLSEIEQWVKRQQEKFSVTTYEWLKRLAHISMTKIAEEQGEWAGRSARKILKGGAIRSIPMTTNRHWNVYTQPARLKRVGVELPLWIKKKATVIR